MRANSAAEKLVALAYADRHNEETGSAYPSLAWLCEFSSLNRKTVIAAVMRLEAIGFLTDTGERRGDTRQIKVYRLNLETVPEAERFQKRNGTEKGAKQSQKRDTEPVRTGSSPKATPSPKKSAGKPAAFVVPDDIPADDWRDFEEMRRTMGKPMTDSIRHRAVARLRRFAEDGYPPGAVLNHSILNNYQGLFPPKDADHGTARSDRRPSARPTDGFAASLHRAAGFGGADHRC